MEGGGDGGVPNVVVIIFNVIIYISLPGWRINKSQLFPKIEIMIVSPRPGTKALADTRKLEQAK